MGRGHPFKTQMMAMGHYENEPSTYDKFRESLISRRAALVFLGWLYFDSSLQLIFEFVPKKEEEKFTEKNKCGSKHNHM
jgi:hypothetical protein